MNAAHQDIDTIDREAAQWVDRMNRPLHDAEVAAEFDRWIMDDPRHVESYARLQALWQSGNLCTALQAGEDEPEEPGVDEDTAATLARQAWKQFAGFAAAALCLVGLVSLGAQALVSESSYAAVQGTTRAVVLTDGSKVRLSGGTRMSVRMTPWSREVALQNGEAFFDVAHEKLRTFSVNTGSSSVTVLGTAFDIDLVDHETRVVRVYRGLVSVDAGAGRQWRLPAGSAIEVGGGRVRSLGEVRGDHPGWIDGWFDADDTSVQQLVRRINRGSRLPVVLADPGLGDLLVTGRFQTSDAEMVLEAVAAIHDLQWRKEPARYVLSR